MSDFKSKLPDLKELGEITGKLFKDIKTSVTEIIDTYKQKHAEPEKTAEAAQTEAKTTAEPEKSAVKNKETKEEKAEEAPDLTEKDK